MPLWQPTAGIARPAYYDRDPIPQLLQYSATNAPHGVTVRASYAPANPYAAFVEHMMAEVLRLTAAAAVSRVWCYVRMTSFLGPVTPLLFVDHYNNTLGALETQNEPGGGYMAFGDMVEILTADQSTGGTCVQTASVKATEFLY